MDAAEAVPYVSQCEPCWDLLSSRRPCDDQLTCWKRVSVSDILAMPLTPRDKSRLETLPTELILEILTYLPRESHACLAVGSRLLATKLGRQYLLCMQAIHGPSDRSLWKYLQLQQRDRPSFFPCRRGGKLHSLLGDHNAHPERERRWLPVIQYDIRPAYLALGSCDAAICYDISFYQLEFALARHRYNGLPDGPLQSLSWSNMQPQWRSCETKIFNTEARLVSGHLLIRTQHILELDFRPPAGLAKYSDYAAVPGWVLYFTFCKHFDLNSWGYGFRRCSPKDIILHCEGSHDSQNKEFCKLGCDFRPLCPCCPTEVSLEKVMIQPDWYFVVLIQWRDMGTCLSPGCPVWRAHTTHSWLPRSEYPGELRNWGWMEPKCGLADIRERYEKQQGATAGELTLANLQKIRGQCLVEQPPSWVKNRPQMTTNYLPKVAAVERYIDRAATRMFGGCLVTDDWETASLRLWKRVE